MAESIGIERVQQLLAAGAQLVDVLPEEEYAEEHLPGALHLPLKKLEVRPKSRCDLALLVKDTKRCAVHMPYGPM